MGLRHGALTPLTMLPVSQADFPETVKLGGCSQPPLIMWNETRCTHKLRGLQIHRGDPSEGALHCQGLSPCVCSHIRWSAVIAVAGGRGRGGPVHCSLQRSWT